MRGDLRKTAGSNSGLDLTRLRPAAAKRLGMFRRLLDTLKDCCADCRLPCAETVNPIKAFDTKILEAVDAQSRWNIRFPIEEIARAKDANIFASVVKG